MKSIGSFLSVLMLCFIPFPVVGQSWSPNTRVNDVPDLSGLYLSSVAVDAGGNAYAVWEDNRNGNDDIYFSFCPTGGNWGSNVKVNDDIGSYDQTSSSVAVTSGGDAYAVWQDNRNGNDDIYFSFRSAGGSWGENTKVNDDIGTYSQRSPCIAVDPNGNAYAIWVDERNSLGGPNNDIYFAYRPAGGSWGANVKVNDDLGLASQGYPSIAVDRNGNAYALWYDLRDTLGGQHYDIYFAYRQAHGNWQTNVKVNDDVGDHYKSDTSIAVDNSSNAYAVWSDSPAILILAIKLQPSALLKIDFRTDLRRFAIFFERYGKFGFAKSYFLGLGTLFSLFAALFNILDP